jgi:hypothetical protein
MEERKRTSLHDRSSSTRPSSMRDAKPREERKRPSLHDHSSSMSDEKPRDPREKKAPGEMKGRHRAERTALYQAHRSESRDMSGNQSEEKRQMMLRHEKAIADMQEKQEREMTGAPRWRKV